MCLGCQNALCRIRHDRRGIALGHLGLGQLELRGGLLEDRLIDAQHVTRRHLQQAGRGEVVDGSRHSAREVVD